MSKKQLDDFLPVLEAVGQSVKRTRNLVFILSSVCVILLATYWNLRGDNWTHSKIRTYDAAIAILEGKISEQDKRYQLDPKFREQVQRGRSYLNKGNSQNVVKLKAWVDIYEQRAIEMHTLKFPIIPVEFDSNDTGLASGTVLVVLMVMLFYSLKRESSNVRFAFEVAKENLERKRCLELLAMEQLFLIPPKRAAGRRGRPSSFLYFLLWMPLLIQAAITWEDVRWARGVGTIFSPGRMSRILVVDYFSCALLGVFAASCTLIAYQLMEAWNEEMSKADESSQLGPERHVV